MVYKALLANWINKDSLWYAPLLPFAFEEVASGRWIIMHSQHVGSALICFLRQELMDLGGLKRTFYSRSCGQRALGWLGVGAWTPGPAPLPDLSAFPLCACFLTFKNRTSRNVLQIYATMCIVLSEKLDSKGHILYDSHYVAFWKRQNYGVRKQINSGQEQVSEERGLIIKSHKGTFEGDRITLYLDFWWWLHHCVSWSKFIMLYLKSEFYCR